MVSVDEIMQELMKFRLKVELICYCGEWLRPMKFCPWPGLPDELVLCPECGRPPKVLHDLELGEHFVWNGKQYVTYSAV